MFNAFVDYARSLYGDGPVALHEPRFIGNEKNYLNDTIDSGFVSSVGEYVNEFERRIADYVGARFAVATVNGTAALHAALHLAGVREGDVVITQSLSFVASCNAIRYCGAQPVFVDVDAQTLGLSAQALEVFLHEYTQMREGVCVMRQGGETVRACVPMHTFGHPVQIDQIKKLCEAHGVFLVEDAAESLGSFVGKAHTGTFGRLGILSFNGNKIITTGGGGMIVTDDEVLARRAKHLTTTAKQPHAWRYYHDESGFNYRLPNLNAALGCAQMEQLPGFIQAKRALAQAYQDWGRTQGLAFVCEPPGTRANYWLNAIRLADVQQRDAFLAFTNERAVMTRPVWEPMHTLPMFRACARADLSVTEHLAQTLVNVPSSVPVARL